MSLARFVPQPGRGAAVDEAVRRQLADSLEQLYPRAEHFIDYDKGAFQRLLKDIRLGPCRPAVFGTYTELVEEIGAGAVDQVQRLSDQLLALKAPSPDTRIVTLTDDALGSDQARRYARLVNDDPGAPFRMRQVSDLASASAAVTEALSLIRSNEPALADEIGGLTREIVLAEPDGTATGRASRFDGASTFYLWGAVFLRSEGLSRVHLAETLAHETGHLLLFGLTMGQPLVENNADERFDSPVRSDPRPMDGLVHAAYVLARMFYCLRSLDGSDLLSSEEQDKVLSKMDGHRVRFGKAKALIDERARFTPAGAEIFDHAVEYMNEATQPA